MRPRLQCPRNRALRRGFISVEFERNSQFFHMHLRAQFLTVIPQPLLSHLVFGHDGSHLVPEVFRMVHVGQVAELVHHHIIQYLRGCKDQSVIKGQSSPGGAAAPAAPLVPYGNGSIVPACQGLIECHTFLKFSPSFLTVSFFKGFQPSCFDGSQVDYFLFCHIFFLVSGYFPVISHWPARMSIQNFSQGYYILLLKTVFPM